MFAILSMLITNWLHFDYSRVECKSEIQAIAVGRHHTVEGNPVNQSYNAVGHGGEGRRSPFHLTAVQRTSHAHDPLLHNMCVYHRCSNILVSQQPLNGSDALARFQQVGVELLIMVDGLNGRIPRALCKNF